MMSKHSKFGVGTFNTFWATSYILKFLHNNNNKDDNDDNQVIKQAKNLTSNNEKNGGGIQLIQN